MRSAIVLTREIDDLNVAAEELTSGIREKIAFGRSSAGIVYCDADVDAAALGRLLHENLGFDIVGLTTTAVTFAEHMEDIILQKFLHGVERGFYIDVGCAHPDKVSVTSLFYRLGWRGVNIDARREMDKAMKR